MTQNIPVDLTFTGSSGAIPTYGANYMRYLGCQPTPAGYASRTLHNGYGIGAAGVASALSNTNPACWITNEWIIPAADISITAVFTALGIVGPATVLDWVERSVIGRVQNGTLSGDGTGAVRYVSVDCYQWRIYISGVNIVCELRKIVTGVATVLKSATFPAHLIQAAGGVPVGMILDITGSGPVTLSGWLGAWSVTGEPVTQPKKVMSYIDSSSPITSFGRVGFGMGTARDSVVGTLLGIGGSVVDICNGFEAKNSAGALMFRDEFKRVGLASLGVVPVDYNGVQGRPLAGRFSRDQFGPVDSGNDEIMQRDTVTANRIRLDLDSDANWAAPVLDLRPVTDTTRAHRKVTLTLEDNSGQVSIGGGVMVYASQVTAATAITGELGFTDLKGYAAVCKHTNSGDLYSVALYRYGADFSNAKIAELTDTGSGSPFPHGTAFTLALEAYPSDNQGGYPNASVTLKVYIDDVQVVLGSVAATPFGITVKADGTVVDANENRVKGGPGEGLYVCGQVNGGYVFVDNWQELALHEAGTDPVDQPPVTFGDEGTASESLDDLFTPAWSVDFEADAPIVEIPFESGHRHTRPRFTTPTGAPWGRRTWNLTSPPMTKARADALQEQFEDGRGTVDAYTFTDPRTGDEETVHFLEDSLTVSKVGPGTYVVSFAVEELV